MNIDKAIEILKLVDDTPPSGVNEDFKDAIKLGIEGLKDKETERIFLAARSKQLLPGETEN